MESYLLSCSQDTGPYLPLPEHLDICLLKQTMLCVVPRIPQGHCEGRVRRRGLYACRYVCVHPIPIHPQLNSTRAGIFFTCSSIRVPHTILFESGVSPLKTTDLAQTSVHGFDPRWHRHSAPEFLSLLTSSTSSSLLV